MARTRVLFVDDEANVREGLRRMLRRHRDEWDVVFAASGAEALEQLATAPFDAVVTDMQMPVMNGAALLEAVLAKHPMVARIVLSGHTDEANAARVLKIAHQYLHKPIDAEALRTAVTRACAARQTISSDRIRSIAASIGTLPSPPQVYMEITKSVASEETNVREIAGIIAQDPALSAKLLQLVNSSFFGLGRRVSSVEHAITLLGLIRLKSLVMSTQIMDQFRPEAPIPGFTIERLLRRSVLTAQAARRISQDEQQEGDRPDQAYAAGLLHDVGLLVLAARQPDGFGAALRRAREEGISICAAEQEVVGATHPEVGACLLELWGLPPRIVEGVALHHRPNDTDFDGVCAVTAVHVAAALGAEMQPEDGLQREDALYGPPLDLAYLTRIGRAGRVGKWRELLAKLLPVAEEAPA